MLLDSNSLCGVDSDAKTHIPNPIVKFDILKGTKIEGFPILGFQVLIKTNSKSKQNLNQFLKSKPNKRAEPKSY